MHVGLTFHFKVVIDKIKKPPKNMVFLRGKVPNYTDICGPGSVRMNC